MGTDTDTQTNEARIEDLNKMTDRNLTLYVLNDCTKSQVNEVFF